MLQKASLSNLANLTESSSQQQKGPWTVNRQKIRSNKMTVSASRPFNTTQHSLKLGEQQPWLVVVFDKDGPAYTSQIMDLELDSGFESPRKGRKKGKKWGFGDMFGSSDMGMGFGKSM